MRSYGVIDGEEVFSCPTCLDTGLATVLNPYRWNEHNQIAPLRVICGCVRGMRMAEWRRDKNLKKIAPLDARCVLYKRGWKRDDYEKAIAQTRSIESHPNFSPELAEAF